MKLHFIPTVMVWPLSAAEILMLGGSALCARPIPVIYQDRARDPRDLHHCRLRASHTADNDIRFTEDRRPKPMPTPLPEPVAHRILDHVSAIAKKQFTEIDWVEARQTCSDIFSPVFRLNGPAALQLYVAPRDFPLGNSVDYSFMYDPRTGAVTKSPPLIFTKWWQATGASDILKKYPVVRMEVGRDNLPPVLIVEERTHNGNVYDAAVYRYFEIGKDMSLTQVLAVEARAILLSSEYTERKAVFLTPNRVRLDISTRSPRKWGAEGSVILERTNSGERFHVARRAPAPGTKSQGLVTYCASAKSDDDFLGVGCDLYY